MTEIILYSISTLVAIGTVVGVGLSFAAKRFKVVSNPKKDEILDVLPGANCGACGFVGCEQYAEAIVEKEVDISLCKPGGGEVSKKIADILGKEVGDISRKVAVVLCNGGDKCKDDFLYSGIESCSYAKKFFGGQKKCKYGCLGFGDCVKVCPFGAIYINENKVASFFDNFSNIPLFFISSNCSNLAIDFFIVSKFVNVPPNHLLLT